MIKRFQKNLEASSNQLLLAYTPYCFAVLSLLSPVDSLLPNTKYVARLCIIRLLGWCDPRW